jgi:hypothetical protein
MAVVVTAEAVTVAVAAVVAAAAPPVSLRESTPAMPMPTTAAALLTGMAASS